MSQPIQAPKPNRDSAGSSLQPESKVVAKSILRPARVDLRIIGRTLDDLEKLRVQTQLRIGAAEREMGTPLPHLHYALEPLADAEHRAVLELCRAWRKHPLAGWQRGYMGLGEKSAARLMAIIGDPTERPNPAKLFAYCGHGNAALRKTKGMSQTEAFALGNPWAKKQVWLISCSMLKAGNRAVYDAERERTLDKTHAAPCVRCGPSGKPAPAGSPWSDGHKHASALRVQGKAFLLDLWLAAMELPT